MRMMSAASETARTRPNTRTPKVPPYPTIPAPRRSHRGERGTRAVIHQTDVPMAATATDHDATTGGPQSHDESPTKIANGNKDTKTSPMTLIEA